MDIICWIVVGHVSNLIGNSKVGVTYSSISIPCMKSNWTWGVEKVNFWTRISSDRVITFCSKNHVVCKPNILIMLSLEMVMRIWDNCFVTIEFESVEKCSAHHTTSLGKWKTWGTMQRGRPDSQTWNLTVSSLGLLRKKTGRFWRLEHDKIGSENSHCWSTTRLFSGSLTQCMVRAILMDSMVFIIYSKMILTCLGFNCFENGGWELCTVTGLVAERRAEIRWRASKITKLANESIHFYMPLKIEIIWDVDLIGMLQIGRPNAMQRFK